MGTVAEAQEAVSKCSHRDARFMGNFSPCMGLLLRFLTAPTPRSDVTGMHVDVLDCDALLTLAAVTVEGFGQRRVAAASRPRGADGGTRRR